MIHVAARKLGCSPKTVYNYAKRYPIVQEAVDDERGHFVDTAELGLKRAVLNGAAWAIRFTLETLGKDRGYTKRVEVENDPIDWKHVPDDILQAYCDGKLSDDEVRTKLKKIRLDISRLSDEDLIERIQGRIKNLGGVLNGQEDHD